MTWSIPSPEEQVQFLRNVQRLLAEGVFVSSYKFALIHALADLAVLKGQDTGAPLDLDTKDIAAKFVELYWRQSRPFSLYVGPQRARPRLIESTVDVRLCRTNLATTAGTLRIVSRTGHRMPLPA
jgi:hypothetical protein